ncbi:MAG: DUF1015 domain-containing protein [Chloroflexi bacterium]|nr:DUF1015 domain-containing protein [Chloroflexota bacterium]
MAEIRPFRGLRYRAEVAGDLSAVLAPPYDVIDGEEQSALHERSSFNIVRLELGEPRDSDSPGENRYTRAAAALRDFCSTGAIAQEERPALYLYKQRFEHEGRARTRTALLVRLRLEPWEAGVMLPHEETMAAPKEDRLQLLRHLRTNVSPLFALYRDADARAGHLLQAEGEPDAQASTSDGQRHSLYVIDDPTTIEPIATAFRDVALYMADGHHRYETALAYRDERRAQAAVWSGEEPENFALVALTAVEDAGLALLPTHRLVRPPSLPPDLPQRLERFFYVEDITPKSYDGTALLRLLARLTAAGTVGTAFGALGLEEGRLHLLTLRDAAAAQRLMPDRSAAWQTLDVNVLEYAVLRETLRIDDANESQGYTDDAQEALREVEAGRWPLAFLLNGTPVEQVLAVADAGDLMPRKSTYFAPKLPTGLVLYAFD